MLGFVLEASIKTDHIEIRFTAPVLLGMMKNGIGMVGVISMYCICKK